MKAFVPKRGIALLLALVMALSLLPQLAFAQPTVTNEKSSIENPFKDVKEKHWFYNAVLWAVANGITTGKDATHFAPTDTCTRAEVVTFLYAAFHQPEVHSTQNPFKDVKEKHWFYNAVLWAVENGITTGKDATHFAPTDTCTRAEVVTFLYAAFQQPEVQSKENPFKDVKDSNWFYNAVLWAVENGITTGKDATHFAPKDTCTRAEIVTFLYAAFGEKYQGFVSQLVNGKYVRAEDDDIYNGVFGAFGELNAKARAASTNDERFVLEAQAEAELLDAAAVKPTTTKGGSYVLSRIAPHTSPAVAWGADEYMHSMVVSDEFLTTAEREELCAMWAKAVAGEGSYDPAAYLTGKGHTIQTELTTSYNWDPDTLDWMNSYSVSRLAYVGQCVDGLVEYDLLMNLQPKLAESWEVSDDGMTYTFHIRRDAKWYTADGTVYAPVTARDFVCGFRHMLDCQAGLEGLAIEYAKIKNAYEYDEYDTDFDEVGVKALDDYTLVYTLEEPVPYFMSLLTYPIFRPICASFYEANGGVYGMVAYANRDESYRFGLVDDVSSQVYCGPYLLQKLEPETEILCVKNPDYYDADHVTLNSIKWIYDPGDEPVDYYNDAVSGVFASVTLSYETLAMAKADGNFDKYAYVSETEGVTYFDTLNVNRGAFALENGNCASSKSEQQKADTATAMNNKMFRKAVMHAVDKKAVNAASRGDELAETNLRNMLSCPEIVKLEHAFTDENGHTFPAGTMYGEMVQYYCDQLGCKVNCKDGVDGWFNPNAAKEYLAAAKAQLGDAVSWPIQIDYIYASTSDVRIGQAQAYKASVESTLGTDNVVVNLIAADSTEEWLYCVYYIDFGAQGNFDLSGISGWGPDFGDPCCYLNIFDLAVNGTQLRLAGLY